MGIIDFFVDLVDSSRSKKLENQIFELEKKAAWFKSDAIKGLEGDVKEREKEEKDFFGITKMTKEKVESINKTYDKYKQLQERFKHDVKKRLEFAQDWLNLTESFHTVVGARGYEVNIEDEQMQIQEIERRFDKLLKE